MKTVTFGLIGFGRWGEHHARALANVDNAELVAVTARSQETCEKAKKAFGVRAYTDYGEMLEKEDFDVANVVVPNHLHEAATTAALNAGKHVLLEKPMAVSSEQCRSIIAAAERNKRLLYVAFEKRVSPLWLTIKKQIDAGRIGRPLFANLDLWRFPYRSGAGGWRHDAAKIGNWMLEEPIHFIDLACWYLKGKPMDIYAKSNSIKGNHRGLNENMSLMIGFEDDAYAVVNQTIAAYGHHVNVKIVGNKGSLAAKWDGELDESMNPSFSLVHHSGSTIQEIPIEGMAGEYYEIDLEIKDMVNAVITGKAEYLATPQEGKRAVDLCCLGEESARQGKVIRVN